jgi:hypothetical protein
MKGCGVEGCERKHACHGYCAMHWARVNRRGEAGGPEPIGRNHRHITRGGYVFRFAPEHPLCTPGRDYLAEHRIVLYEKIGPGVHPCHWCGHVVSWTAPPLSADELHADHVDRSRDNNVPENLVPSCRRCNFHNVGRLEHVTTARGTTISFVKGSTWSLAYQQRGPSS